MSTSIRAGQQAILPYRTVSFSYIFSGGQSRATGPRQNHTHGPMPASAFQFTISLGNRVALRIIDKVYHPICGETTSHRVMSY